MEKNNFKSTSKNKDKNKFSITPLFSPVVYDIVLKTEGEILAPKK